ncbi:MAG: APC family permease [Thaumarchaeota archaeon]|nr:APC family permease [Nitrososphaerota archaeon]
MADQPKKLFVREATGLVRELGFVDHFFISSGIILVLGGFVITALFTPLLFPGAYLPAVFLVGSIPAWAMAYIYGKLSAGISRSGGDYVWSTRILGPLFGSVQFIFLLLATITFVGGGATQIFFYGLAQFAFGVGVGTHSASLLSLGGQLSSVGLGGPGSFLVLALVTIGALVTLRAFGWIFRITYVFYYLLTIIFIIVVLTIVPSSVPAMFNNAMATAGVNVTYNSVIQSTSSSVPSQFSVSNTLLAAIPLGFTTFIGFNYGTYLAGETKNAKSSLSKALYLAMAVTTILLVAMSYMIYNAFGSTFLSSIAYYYGTNPGVLPVLPTASMLAGLTSPYVAGVLGIGIAISWAVQIMGFLVTFSRIIFAASFDRLLPSAFSKVSDRFHAPYWAVILVSVLSGLYLFFFWYYGIIAAQLNTSYILPIGFALPMIATLLFPVVKRDLYIRVFGSMAGARTLMFASAVGAGAFIFYAIAISDPIVSGVYIGASLPLAIEVAVAGVLIGVGVYLWGHYHARRAGLDLNNIYAEIPPE